ncbi:MAG TPA: transporter substrate-binding domain-containing protein [Magnetospirillum sp.]|nr:transporter substrate-binding domain-containing protein [Magnetospirillum sp.]
MKRIMWLMLALLAPLAARADEVVMAVGRSLPPYIIVDEWRGLEYDVVREALAIEGHTVKPRFMAFARVVKELEAGMVDAAMTMRPDSGVPVHYSDSHVTYRNIVITLARRNLTINRVEDLAGKSVLAFQNATLYLGPAFKSVADANPRYREEARQAAQPLQLFLDRVDAVVSDRFIFGWFANDAEVKAKVDTTQALRFHPIFPPTQYHVAFRDSALRDSFNRGLKKLRESGAYDRIVARYSTYLKEEGGG